MGSGALRTHTHTHTDIHTLTEHVLRVLAEVRTGGGVCGETGAGTFRELSKRDAICVYSAIMSRKQQQQVGSEVGSACLWVINYGFLALAQAPGIYSTFYRETWGRFK